MARDCLKAGKHVLLEKPIALELCEADELIAIAKRTNVKFTIGYSQRFNPKIAYVKKKIDDGTLGKAGQRTGQPPSVTRSLGKKITGRVQAVAGRDGIDARPRLRPVVLEPAKPVRVYSQGDYGYMKPATASLRHAVDHGDDGQRRGGGGRRRLEPAAGLSELLLPPGSR